MDTTIIALQYGAGGIACDGCAENYAWRRDPEWDDPDHVLARVADLSGPDGEFAATIIRDPADLPAGTTCDICAGTFVTTWTGTEWLSTADATSFPSA